MTLDARDVQGLVVTGFGDQPHARLLLRRIDDAATFARWLATAELTTADRTDVDVAVNLALSAGGLRALGIADGELPEAFEDGMASRRGRRVLSDGDGWTWSDGDAGARVDAVVLVYARTEPALRARCDALSLALDAAGAPRAHADRETSPMPRDPAERIEHFGFLDGVSQPRVPEDIPLGEVVHGYPDALGHTADAPLLRNGSYFVVRELVQDVPAFWRAIARAAPGNGVDPTGERLRLAAKMVGRWPSGAPITRFPHADPGPGFEREPIAFAGDRHGHGCPIGAHVRRMNPRDWLLSDDPARARTLSARHRIVRRGRAFGAATGLSAAQMARDPDQIPAGDRGLYFACLNTDLERQFEFLQQSWGHNPKFAGLYRDPDPLFGTGPERCFTEQRAPVRAAARALPTFVTARGGGYFLLPGIAALRLVARRHGVAG